MSHFNSIIKPFVERVRKELYENESWEKHGGLATSAIKRLDPKAILIYSYADGDYQGSANRIYWSQRRRCFLQISWGWGSCELCDYIDAMTHEESKEEFDRKIRTFSLNQMIEEEKERKSWRESGEWTIPYTVPGYFNICQELIISLGDLAKPRAESRAYKRRQRLKLSTRVCK